MNDLFYKDIEIYGLFKMIDKGRVYLEVFYVMYVLLNYDYDVEIMEVSEFVGRIVVLDVKLMNLFKDLWRREVK